MSLSLNIESIILLLFFIAPGFLFTRTYTAYRPRYYRAPNTFAQLVLAIVGSAVIHATLLTGIALGLLIYWAMTGQSPPLPSLSVLLTTYEAPAIALSILLTILYLAFSLVLARRVATYLGRQPLTARPRWWRFFLGNDPPEPNLLWHTILQIDPLNLNLIPPYLTVQLRNGEYFEGELYQMRLVGDEENTVELAMRNLSHRPPNAAASDLAPLPDRVILLRSTDILWITRNDIPQ